MERTQLAPDFEISRVLTGLWQIADAEKDGNPLDPVETARKMDGYVQAGFTTFDMADHYGSAEIIAGTYQSKSKSKVQLLTKWVPQPGELSRQDVRKAVERALNRLKVPSLDLLQYHAWNYADPSYLDQLFWLQELKEEGLIRHLGLTNFDAAHLRVVKSSGIESISNQISYSLLDRRAAGEMITVCNELEVKILAFGTIAGGFLTEKWLNRSEPDEEELNTWSLMKYKRFIDVAGGWDLFQGLLSSLSDVAGKYSVSMANVASRYVLQQPMVVGVILGSRLGEIDHIKENKKLLDFTIDSADIALIESAASQLSPIPGNCGDEYRKPPYLTASGDLSHHLDSLPLPFEAVENESCLRISSGTTWEDQFGYCRAVKKGNRILVSGTTASHGDRLIGGKDPVAQTHFVIDKIEGAIQSLGGKLENVIRTRIYISDLKHWKNIAMVHGDRFASIRPVNTLIQAGLVGEDFLVEMEAEAILD